MASETVETRTAPYVPFRTLLNAVERLAPDIPKIIDKTHFNSFSGGIKTQLLAAFRFMGLIDEKGHPTEFLEELVENPETRKATMQYVLRRAYSEVFLLDLTTASPGQLDQAIALYSVTGATHRKAVSFFVQAARFAGIVLSPYITDRKKRGPRKANGSRKNSEIITLDLNEMAEPDVKRKTITLRSGDGEITLSTSFDPFTISRSDRDFLFSLIDALGAYENPPVKREKPVSDPDDSFRGITDDDVPF